MTLIRKTLAAAGLVLAIPALAKAEDLTIVSSVKLGKGAPATATQYVSQGKVRTSDGQTDTIMDYASGRMIVVNHQKKEYYETTFQEMAAMFEELDRQLKANPVLEKMMGKVTDVTVTKGGPARTIAGYSCDPYTLAMGESLKFDVCAAPALEAPQQYFDARKAAYAAMGPVGRRFERMFEEMKKVKGMPISMAVSAKMMIIKQETITEATEIKKGPLPASAFEPPAGYKKKDSPYKKKA